MSESEVPGPAKEGETAPSTLAPPASEEQAPNRTWFVVFAWITLIIFGAFVAWITILAIMIPDLQVTP